MTYGQSARRGTCRLSGQPAARFLDKAVQPGMREALAGEVRGSGGREGGIDRAGAVGKSEVMVGNLSENG